MIPIASALLLSAAGNAGALPPSSKKTEGAAKEQQRRTYGQNQATPQSCPSVTVVFKEIPAPEAKQITAVIQQQPYEHWWQGPHGAEWALFLLTIPYVAVSIGLFAVTKKAADAAKGSAVVAQQALEITNRARVSIEDVEISVGAAAVSFNLRNSGAVPATAIGFLYHRGFDQSIYNISPETVYRAPEIPGRGETLAAQESRPFQKQLVPLDQSPAGMEEIGEVMNGAVTVNVGIIVSYLDGFGKERTRWRWYSASGDPGKFKLFASRQY